MPRIFNKHCEAIFTVYTLYFTLAIIMLAPSNQSPCHLILDTLRYVRGPDRLCEALFVICRRALRFCKHLQLQTWNGFPIKSVAVRCRDCQSHSVAFFLPPQEDMCKKTQFKGALQPGIMSIMEGQKLKIIPSKFQGELLIGWL